VPQRISTALLIAVGSLIAAPGPAAAQSFGISLPTHNGQLKWEANGFRIVQSSAKPNDDEIGVRGKNESARWMFLGFLFTVSGQTQLTSAKCRDDAMAETKRENPSLRFLADSEIATPTEIPVEFVSYQAAAGSHQIVFSARGFAAKGDLCGDLEVYSDSPLSPTNGPLKQIFESLRLDPNYQPQFRDVLLYAQLLYEEQVYKSAAPLFELALAKLPDDPSQIPMRRALTDQAGMSYGIAGDIPKSRAIFESAIAKDSEYPLYYYNLACADAQEHKLSAARLHLQEAFARKANVLPGESMPQPAKDGSFLPYRNDKSFWAFIESLH